MLQPEDFPKLHLFKASSSKFSIWVEETLLDYPEMGYLGVICSYCEEHGCEYEDVATLISPVLKQKIYEEASKEYSMPKTGFSTCTFDDSDG